MKFPVYAAATTLRPDMVLELTVPWEDHIKEANKRKRAKYAELVEECRSNGWRTRSEPLEVGYRGFTG